MKTICIFNPEHDLCLANGGANYMPPASAMVFASKSADLMRWVYPDAQCVSVDQFVVPSEPYAIIPWGWNRVLKNQLLRLGAAESQLPSDEVLSCVRNLQHRSTALPLQSDVCECRTLDEVEVGLSRYGSIVLKSPLSGSGRGLRWINESFVENDLHWISKQLQHHHSVMLEPKREVVCDFALEYCSSAEGVSFMGYSLFDTRNGVYRGNVMWSDDTIARHIEQYVGEHLHTEKSRVESFLSSIAAGYCGFLGVDLMVCREGEGYRIHVAEINFRHTMGLIAHEVYKRGCVEEGSVWVPEVR